jgi:DNA-binding transcriptional MerR regulator
MGKYSIKEVEALSGVKAHTLRIWEQRHELVIPKRTDTNIRYYTDEQLRQILNISLLNQSGIKISHIAKFTDSEIIDKINELESTESPHDLYINPLINSMIDLDEVRFSESVNKAIANFPFNEFCADIVFAFLKRIGILWISGSITPAQEHFASNILKRKVICATENLDVPIKPNAKKFVLFLPEGDYHELSLLMSEYIIKSSGHQSYYFGTSLPLVDLEGILKSINADYLFCVMLVCKELSVVQEELDTISNIAGKRKVLIAGLQNISKSVSIPKNCLLMSDIRSLVDFCA